MIPSLARVMPRRVISLDHWTGASFASCLGCDWTRSEPDAERWPRVRSAAHRHVATTGHPVKASRQDCYTYGPRPGNRP
jgi:hypothetical protein